MGNVNGFSEEWWQGLVEYCRDATVTPLGDATESSALDAETLYLLRRHPEAANADAWMLSILKPMGVEVASLTTFEFDEHPGVVEVYRNAFSHTDAFPDLARVAIGKASDAKTLEHDLGMSQLNEEDRQVFVGYVDQIMAV